MPHRVHMPFAALSEYNLFCFSLKVALYILFFSFDTGFFLWYSYWRSLHDIHCFSSPNSFSFWHIGQILCSLQNFLFSLRYSLSFSKQLEQRWPSRSIGFPHLGQSPFSFRLRYNSALYSFWLFTIIQSKASFIVRTNLFTPSDILFFFQLGGSAIYSIQFLINLTNNLPDTLRHLCNCIFPFSNRPIASNKVATHNALIVFCIHRPGI